MVGDNGWFRPVCCFHLNAGSGERKVRSARAGALLARLRPYRWQVLTYAYSGSFGCFRMSPRNVRLEVPVGRNPALAAYQTHAIGAFAATQVLRYSLWTASTSRTERLGTDRYGRVLAELHLGGQPVKVTMIAHGVARPYDGGRREGWCQ